MASSYAVEWRLWTSAAAANKVLPQTQPDLTVMFGYGRWRGTGEPSAVISVITRGFTKHEPPPEVVHLRNLLLETGESEVLLTSILVSIHP